MASYLKDELYTLIKTDDSIFDFIQNSALDGLWYRDLEHPEHKWMNPKFWVTLGYDPSTMLHTASAWEKVIVKKDFERANLNLARHLANPESPYDQTVRYIHSSGKTVWIRCKGVAIRDNSGKPVRMLGAHTDVTELKQKEVLLDRCNSEANIGYWILELIENTIFWSSMTKNIHEVGQDYEPTLAEGINFYEEGYSRDRITELVGKAIADGEPFEEELTIVTATGKKRWVKAIGIPEFENQQCFRLYGTFQDIDQRKRAKIRLTDALQEKLSIFDASTHVSIIETGLDGIIKTFNKGAENLLGYTAEEVVGVSTPQMIHIFSEIEQRAEELSRHYGIPISPREVFTLEAKNGRPDTREWTYVGKAGNQFPVQLTMTAVKNGDEITGYLGIGMDISKLKKSENETKELLKVTTDQNERLKNFAHIVSHNLRSHSSGISMLLNLYKADRPELFEDEMMKLLSDASDNLGETIDHLTKVVEMSFTTKEKLEQVNLKAVIDKNVCSTTTLAKNADVHICNTVSDQVVIKAIPAYLDSIVLNFLTNGIKYRSEDRKSYLYVSSYDNDDYQVVEFKDNGLGINLKLHKQKLFGMYKTFHSREDSRGIGLFITKNQVESMGGKIDVESEENCGTTFKIYLPK